MDQGLVQAVGDHLVDGGLLSFKNEVDFFAGLPFQLAHHAPEAAEDLADRDQAQFRGGILHLPDYHCEPVRGFLEFCQIDTGEVGRAHDLGNAEAEFPNQIHEAADFFGRNS